MQLLSGLATLALLSSTFTSVIADPIIIDPEVARFAELTVEQHARSHAWALRDLSVRKHTHGHGHVHKKRDDADVAAASSTVSLIASPSVASVAYLGGTTNVPSKMYFWPLIASPALPTFTVGSPYHTVATSISKPLATGFPIYNGTGAVVLTHANQNQLYYLSTLPSISRDSGRGGYVNGSKIFVFSDTEVFTHPTEETPGVMTSFTTNSAAADIGFNGANGMAPAIRDGVGVWANNNGGQRVWIPFTTGEKEYNLAMGGYGGRIAIWPSSAITPLYDGVGIQFAPIVLVNSSNPHAVSFHQVGITMYEISVPNKRSGPVAKRTAPYLFPGTPGPSFGISGATRSWGSQGVGGKDGWVYAYAVNSVGLVVTRVEADSVADIGSYEYYWPSTKEWNSTVTTQTFLNGSYSSCDIFYSAHLKTFVNIYADRYIDSKFLWRYLMVPAGGIVPAYDGTDFVENILKYQWSPVRDLWQAPIPGNGQYIYSAGPHPGYFEEDDIYNGGTQMLLTWTAPTGKASDSVTTGYAIPAAVITFA